MKDGFYKNYPEEFYLINDLVPHIYKDINLDPRKADILILITTFDYINRCVNYYALIPKRKRFDEKVKTEDKKLSTNIRDYLLKKQHIKSRNSYLDKYFKHERFRNTKEFFKKNLRNCGDHELHYHFAKLYHFFPINSQKYIDGVLKKVLSEKNEFSYVEIEEKEWPYIKLWLYDTNRNEISIKWGDKKYDNPQIINQLKLTIAKKSFKKKAKADRSADRSLDPKLFWEYFLSAMVKDDFTGKECVWPFKKGIHNSHVVIPIFDGGLPYEHKGNILSFIYLRFKSKNGAKDYLKLDKNQQPIEEIRNKWGPHIAEIAFDARRYELISQNIKHAGDILKDLLLKVAFIQDWERIMVFGKSSDQEPQFCFKRFPGDQVGRLEYEKVWGVCEREEKCKGCEDLLNGLKKTLYKNEKVHKNGNNFIFFQKMDDFLDPKVLPSIEDADIARYKNHILCFEFPQYTFFPTETNTEQNKKKAAIEKLGEHYINKLIPIFDRLLLKRKVLRHSVTSAVSAIISRNHSHHIGSHVMPRTSVNKIKKKLKKRIKNGISNDIRLNIIHRLKTRLDEYIQQKADFMAEIATEPLISTKTLSFSQEIIIPFVTNTLLMDNLCANEGICYPENKICGNRLKIFVTFKDIPLDASFNCGEDGCDAYNKLSSYPYHDACNKCNNEIKFQSIEGGDFDLAVPGPLGEHAFYSFLENFIRNAAKHNRKEFENNKNKNLKIHIDVSEIGKKDINDEDNTNFFKEEDKDTFYKVEIWDNVTKPSETVQGENLVDFLNKKIGNHIIEKDGSLKREAWGIAEMKVMATLLKGSSDFMRLHENLLVKKSKENHVVYVFKIMKPKKVALIFEQLPDDSKQEKHKKGGVWWFDSLEKFIAQSERGKSIASFEFAVIGKQLAKDFSKKKEKDKKKIFALLPFRVMIEGKNDDVVPGAAEINDKFRELSAEDILRNVWERWIEHVAKKNPYSLVIYLGETENKSWANFADREIRDKNITLHILSRNSKALPFNANNRFLMYDRHFDALDHNSALMDKPVFHEIIDKNSSDFIHIFSHSNEEIFYGLVEASLLNVLIIDERVAEVAYEDIMSAEEKGVADDHYGGRSRLQAFRHGKVFICTHIIKKGDTIPLHHSIKDEYPRISIKLSKGKAPSISWEKTNDKKEEDLPLPDIVIIHQGIMKDILKVTDLRAFIDGLREHIPYVAIVSGRGIPPDLPKTEKFVPFSLLEKWVMKERLSKYSLIKFLMPLKRRDVV